MKDKSVPRVYNIGPHLIETSFKHIVLSRITDDTPNVAAMVEESRQLLEVIDLLGPIDGSTSHQLLGVQVYSDNSKWVN